MTAQPLFLVRVSAMFTSDDADSVVPSAEMIVVDGWRKTFNYEQTAEERAAQVVG